MGPHCGRSRAAAVPPYHVLLVVAVVCCMAPVAATPECRTTEACCGRELRGCWTLYGRAKDTLGVRDEFSAPGASARARARVPPAEVRARCTAMRTFYLCIGNQSRLCHGNLNYHSAHRGIERQMKRFNCSMRGELFRPDEHRNPPPLHGRADVCAYRKSSGGGAHARHRLCALFGDPHLRTFGGDVETCSAQGAWPLVDNKHLTVQVTNEPVAGSKGRATAITKVTVMVKQHGECASPVFVTYQAALGELPGAFDDGSVELGGNERAMGGSGVRLREQTAGRHVEIHLRYVDTTVVLRRAGSHYSVVVRMPAAVVNASVADDPDGLQLCVRGCPHSERINYREFIALRSTRLKQQRRKPEGAAVASTEVTSSADEMARDKAASHCRDAGVVDHFFDACVFDLVSTGDLNFTQAARHAQRDTLRLLPESAAELRNRTSLAELDRLYSGGAGRTSGGACVVTCFLVTLCAVLISELLTSAAGGATWPRERCRAT